MPNYDAIIWFGGIGVLLLLWIVTFIIRRRIMARNRKAQLAADARVYQAYFDGWDDGAESTLELVTTYPGLIDAHRQKHHSR